MKAMILAAGKGQRLQPITTHTPKALAEVHGKPIIVRHIESLKKAGIKEIVINVYYMKDKIINALGNGEKFGVKILYSAEQNLLDTGGGVKNALHLLGDAEFLLINADVYSIYNYQKLALKRLTGLAHLVVVPTPSWKETHDLSLNGDVVTFETKTLTFSGIAKISPKLFIKTELNTFSITKLYKLYAEQHSITGELFEGVWQDIGTLTVLNWVNDLSS